MSEPPFIEVDATLAQLVEDLDLAEAEDPRTELRAALTRLARGACDAGDHHGEERVARWRLEAEVDDDVASRADAWRMAIDATRHLADAATQPAERSMSLQRLRATATDAIDDIRARCADAENPAGAERRLIDPIARILLAVEAELGIEPSAPAAELTRRDRDRAARTATGPTFTARHAEDLVAFRAGEARAWYEARFLERHGVRPPSAWWLGDGADGWIAPEAAHLFDADDHVAFLDETEARFRAERGLPAHGEGWVSAASLARCVADVLPGVEVRREARLPWLGRQSLDILLPELGVAIEYQGEQHYLPLGHWGGDAGLAARRELDERKRDACVRQGVRLLEWRYDEPITNERVRRRLQDASILPVE